MPRARKTSPRVKVDISQEIIDNSVRADSSHCMIAEAVKAAYPKASRVAVDLQTIRFTDPERQERITYLTPRAAQIALCKFDEGVATEPFDFVLRGGQVTKTSTRVKRDRAEKNRTEAQDATTKKAQQSSQHVHFMSEPRNGMVPDIEGGSPPPRGALPSGNVPKGRRRAFGMRRLALGAPGETLRAGSRVGDPASVPENYCARGRFRCCRCLLPRFAVSCATRWVSPGRLRQRNWAFQ